MLLRYLAMSGVALKIQCFEKKIENISSVYINMHIFNVIFFEHITFLRKKSITIDKRTTLFNHYSVTVFRHNACKHYVVANIHLARTLTDSLSFQEITNNSRH